MAGRQHPAVCDGALLPSPVTVAEFVRVHRLARNWSVYELARQTAIRLGKDPTVDAIKSASTKIHKIEAGTNRLGKSNARPFATALGQALEGDPTRLLRIAGLEPPDGRYRYPSPVEFFGADPRLLGWQREMLCKQFEAWGLDPDQPGR